MTLVRTREAFDHTDFVFELNYDGFRAPGLRGRRQLPPGLTQEPRLQGVSALARVDRQHLRADNAVLDGELAAPTRKGSRNSTGSCTAGEPVFVAFHLLWLNGRDLRGRSLVDRKAALRTLICNGGRDPVR
jgi:bifunctional non-homologous end joining protein LigD